MTATAILFTYRSMQGLTAAARGLGLPEALLDVPHYGFVRFDGFELKKRGGDDLPGVKPADLELAFALDRWLVMRHLLNTQWKEVLRPDYTNSFHHGVMEHATMDELRAELEAAGYTVIEWASARAVMQPRRPAQFGGGFLAAARRVAGAEDPGSVPVPELPAQIDLNGEEDDEAIRVLAGCGQLWRARWWWNRMFDGDPDDIFKVEALSRAAGMTDHDWARFLALAGCGGSHPGIELWLVAHVRTLVDWLKQACKAAPGDVAWISERLRGYLAKGDAWIEPLAKLRAKATSGLANLARGAGAPPVVEHVVIERGDPSYARRQSLLLLGTPGQEARACAEMAMMIPSTRGGGLDGLISVKRLVVDDARYRPHLPDVATGMRLLGWSVPEQMEARALQRVLRSRAEQLDAAILAAVREHWPDIRDGAFGESRWDLGDDGEIFEPQRDVVLMLTELVDERAVLPELRERRFVGELIVTSGRVVVTDPLTSLDVAALARKVPRGRYRVEVAIDEGGRVGALVVLFAAGLVELWEPARRVGEHEDSRGGFAVDGGIAGVFDAKAAAGLQAVDELYAGMIAPALEDRLAAEVAVAGGGGNLIVTRSGDGDGYYGAWWGLGADAMVRALVIDFGVFEATGLQGRLDAFTLAQLDPWVVRARALLAEHFGPHGFAAVPVVVDRDLDEVSVRVRRADVVIEVAGGFDGNDHMTAASAVLRVFRGEDELDVALADGGVPELGSGPYASLATLDERLVRGGAEFVADIEGATPAG